MKYTLLLLTALFTSAAILAENNRPTVNISSGNENSTEYIVLQFRHNTPVNINKIQTYDTAGRRIVSTLATKCIENRLAEITLNPECGFIYFRCDIVRNENGGESLTLNITPKAGREGDAFRALCTEVERLRRHGITSYEMKHTKDVYMKNLQRASRDENPEARQAAETESRLCQKVIGRISVNELNIIIADFIQSDVHNTNITANIPEQCTVCRMPDKEQLTSTFLAVRDSAINSLYYKKTTCHLAQTEPQPGKVVSRRHINEIDATELTLANGVKVVVRSNDFEENRINMAAVSYGGESRYSGSDRINAMVADALARQMGAGNLPPDEMNKILKDNGVEFYGPTIERFYEQMTGSSETDGFEAMLQANYIYFTAPRKDETLFNTFINSLRSSVGQQSQDPMEEFARRYQTTLEGKSKEISQIDSKTINHIDLNRSLAIYRERFGNPADFTFYIAGEIDPNNARNIALIEKWIGGMTTNGNTENMTADQPQSANGKKRCKFKASVPDGQATTEVCVTGYGIEYSLRNIIMTKMVTRIVSDRLKKMDSDTRFTAFCFYEYGNKTPQPVVRLEIEFQSDPKTQKVLTKLVHAQLSSVIAMGVTEAEVNGCKTSMSNAQKWARNNTDLIERMQAFREAGLRYDNDYTDTLNSVSAEDIRLFVKQLYEQQNHVEVVMMPK